MSEFGYLVLANCSYTHMTGHLIINHNTLKEIVRGCGFTWENAWKALCELGVWVLQ